MKRSIVIILCLLLFTACAVKKANSRTEAYMVSFSTRVNTRIAYFSGEKLSSVQDGTLLEFIACPDLEDSLKMEFRGEGVSVESLPAVETPLMQIFVSEQTGTFPSEKPSGLYFPNDYSFVWYNTMTYEEVALRCDEEDGEKELVYGPVGDIEIDDWDWESFEERIREETAMRRKGSYKELPLAAFSLPLLVLLLLLFGLLRPKQSSA